MNKLSRYLLSITLIMSTVPAHALNIPSKGVLKKFLYTGVVGLTGLRYFSKTQLSEEELAQRKPIEQEESYVKLLMRAVDELGIGQPGKPKEVESIDPKTGTAKIKKTPATGLVGLIHKWTKKLVVPVASCGIALDKLKATLKESFDWYTNNTKDKNAQTTSQMHVSPEMPVNPGTSK